MQIACVMATRGNPKRAAAVLECANSLASGGHKLDWVICCDHDDTTAGYFKANYPDVRLSVDESQPGVGAVWNRGALLHRNADYIAPFPDDSFPGLPNWDRTIVNALPDPERIGVIAWNDTANPNQCTLPVITRGWFRHAGLYDGRFPYWFYDTCVAELWTFVTGRTVEIPQALLLAARKGKTQGMRELSFWWDYYVFTRHERLAHAAQIRESLGLEMASDLIRLTVERWEARDELARPHLAEMEAGMSGEPRPSYHKAKTRAVSHMMSEAA